MFAVQDNGSTATLLWTTQVPTGLQAAAVVDPRGGLWIYTILLPWLYHLNAQTGSIMETINVSKLVAGQYLDVPSSALSITGSPTSPVLILGTESLNLLASYVIAIDLVTHSLVWEFNLAPSLISDFSAGQFPIVLTTAGEPAVVFSTYNEGAYFLTNP